MMKKWVARAVAPLAFCTVLGGQLALADTVPGDIRDITSTASGQTITTAGTKIPFSIVLGPNGSKLMAFTASYIGVGTNSDIVAALYPLKLKMSTGGYAEFLGFTKGTLNTSANFSYTVREGDFALPLNIAGTAGSSQNEGEGFQWLNYGTYWMTYAYTNTATVNAANLRGEIIWRYGDGVAHAANWNLADSNIRVQTLSFNNSNPLTVAATETLICSVARTGTNTTGAIAFYVWSGNTNTFSIVGQSAGTKAYALSIPSGETSTSFTILGVTPGAADLYVGASEGPLSDGSTNWVTRAVTVTAAPDPTIKVVINGSSTVYESDTSALTFTVQATQAPTTNILVKLTANSSFLRLETNQVLIAKGQLISDSVSFYALNNTDSAAITPATTDPVYKIFKAGTVKIVNTDPIIKLPTTASQQAITLDECQIPWQIEDVTADNATTACTWNWGDGTTNTITHGQAGTATHVFNSPGSYSVLLTVTDGDGGTAQQTFTITVVDPVAKPIVSVVLPSDASETNTTGKFHVQLSQKYPANIPVYVRLDVVQADAGSTNVYIPYLDNGGVIMIDAGQTNSADMYFYVKDGTQNSLYNGVKFTPVVTNVNYYTSRTSQMRIQNISPEIITPSTYSYTNSASIPAGISHKFTFKFNDIAADQDSIRSVWDFGDETATVTTNGLTGSVYHTYASSGIYELTLTVTDKDDRAMGSPGTTKTIWVYVGQLPTITASATASVIYENTTGGGTVQISLSAPFAYPVPVTVQVTPDSNNANGTLRLTQTNILIAAGDTSYTIGIHPTLDGTPLSDGAGFTITPIITEGNTYTDIAKTYFKKMVSANIRVENVKPILTFPNENTVYTKESPLYTVSQGVAASVFSWNVTDVAADLATMSITFNWGDGAGTSSYTGGSGVATHTYTSSSVYCVTVTARDKDGMQTTASFWVQVEPPREVIATPLGRNGNSSYYNLTYKGVNGDLGWGTIASINASGSSYGGDASHDYIYYFIYGRNTSSPTLVATPTTNGTYQSFFYAWDDLGSGSILDAYKDPTQTSQTMTFTFDDNTTGVVVQVRAIFSREYRAMDNVGDINLDGIPDHYKYIDKLITAVNSNGTSNATSSGTTGTSTTGAAGFDIGLYATLDLRNSNPDGDVLPYLGAGGRISITDTKCEPFRSITELRGQDLGLNDPVVGRGADPDHAEDTDLDGPLDEPGAAIGSVTYGTDPTLADTDNDGLPDGYEYYFWRDAVVNLKTGKRYNPNQPGESITINYTEIAEAFNPLVGFTTSSRDTDGDGLSDKEELLLETNPIQWDTDGDGIPDGWEVLMGTDPCKTSDGGDNPDGDWMAYATIDRQMVTLMINNVTTNFLAVGAVEGEPATNGTYYTYYRYGSETGPIAQGHVVQGLGKNATALGSNAVVTAVAQQNTVLLHFQVYQEFGFDPRVAWGQSRLSGVGNSRRFTTKDEFLLCKFMANVVNGDGKAATGDWATMTTCPRTPDTDAQVRNGTMVYDGMPDGWELYVACGPAGTDMTISPWNVDDGWYQPNEDASADVDAEHLPNHREFGGTESSAHYNDTALYTGVVNTNRDASIIGTVTIFRSSKDSGWLNKFWPTDPWNPDTDGDGLTDYKEQATAAVGFAATLQYGSPKDDGVNTCFRGGGLNPCTVDTDWDGLPDGWEAQYIGTNAVSSGTSYAYIEDGMDGTFGPGNDINHPMIIGGGDAFSWLDEKVMGNTTVRREMDFDNDGLENYQEYMVQALRHLRYDLTADGVPMAYGAYDMSLMFTPITNAWDISAVSFWNPFKPVYFQQSVGIGMYVSTDPRVADTDGDGMDDFYELFHGLNPILGASDIISTAYMGMITYSANGWGGSATDPLPMDFVTYPWMAGLDEADPDGDGLLNLEEQIQANTSAPECSNTDPSPLWMTDVYSTNSLTARFYFPGAMFFWDASIPQDNFYYVFSFEMNEGYDTDNDGVCDKAELIKSTQSMSDAQDHDDPLRRQALWFDGEKSAAETMVGFTFNEWAFRSFTVELWARPQDISREQVLIERPIQYASADLTTTGGVVRVNFRIGIKADGRIYAMYQNAGTHDEVTGNAIVYGPALTAGEWVHVAASMDGNNSKFTLYINGVPQVTALSSLIPANGVINLALNPEITVKPEATETYPGMIILGAANINPEYTVAEGTKWESYTNFYKGWIDEVRIWDGARADADILANYNKRFRKTDLEDNRTEVFKSIMMGGTRIKGWKPQLPAQIIYHYTFDNLFAADVTNSVVKAPRGLALAQKPEGYQVGWWSAWETKSDVYTDYTYVPWIENGVDHLASTNGVVHDSRYWGLQYSGVTPVAAKDAGIDLWDFPVSNDPYGFCYRNDMTDGLDIFNSHKGYQTDHRSYMMAMYKASEGTLTTAGDLLPLGNAWAMFSDTMWDNRNSPSSVWAETGTDSDYDGLPDWWETYVKTLYPGVNLGWDSIYPDGSGMTAGERYLRDIATGWTESNFPGAATYDKSKLIAQTSDADGDSLPDWWENIYGLKSGDATGDNGMEGDPDKDGLSNYSEYLISEVYKFAILSPIQFKTDLNRTESDYFLKVGSTYLGAMFSDHDFMEDAWEDAYDNDWVNRYVYDPNQDPDDDGWSNWAECRFGSNSLRTDPMLISRADYNGDELLELPTPMVKVTLQYLGDSSDSTITLRAWHNPAMTGMPDAIYTLPGDGEHTKNIGYWDNTSSKTIKGWLSPGSVLAGTVQFKITDLSSGAATQATMSQDVASSTNTLGVLYLVDSGSINFSYPVGTVNYVTGEFKLDLETWDGTTYATTNSVTTDPYKSYITVTYETAHPEGFPKTFYLTDVPSMTTSSASGGGTTGTTTDSMRSLGYLREGTNYFEAFIGSADASAPYGVAASSYGTEIGWHKQAVNIELTDNEVNQWRHALSGGSSQGTTGGNTGSATSSSASKTRVRIVRSVVNNLTTYRRVIFDKEISTARGMITEADFLADGMYALDWGFLGMPTTILPTTATYQFFLDGPETLTTTNVPDLTFSNTFETVQAQATNIWPKGGSYVYAARPTFKWVMPENYVAFEVQVRKASSATTLWDSGVVRAPIRTTDGVSVWQPPIYAGCKLPSGTVLSSNVGYQWRVNAYNAKYSNSTVATRWSDWTDFRFDASTPLASGGYGAVKACVKYYGPVTNLAGQIKVRAYQNAGFVGDPEAEITLSAAETLMATDTTAKESNAQLNGLAVSSVPVTPDVGPYYLMAFIDQNNNGVRDPWESWGYANYYYDLTDKPYDPKGVSVSFTEYLPVVNITIEDADTDQDWFPDSYEYTLGTTAQKADGSFLTAKGANSSDANDTEINPNLLAGTITRSQLTAMSAFFNLDISISGAAASDSSLVLTLTGLTLGDDGVPSLTVEATRSGTTAKTLSASTETKEIKLLYKKNLSDTEWTVLDTATIPVNGSENTVKFEEVKDRMSGFFMVSPVTK